VWLPPADLADYVAAGELTQVFYFDLLQQPFEAQAFRSSISQCLESLKDAAGLPAWTLNSHDAHRAVTRYGLIDAEPLQTPDINAQRTRARGLVDVPLGIARARAAALLLLALPGPVYLYQGEELGLPEVQDIPDDARRDPIWERSGHTEHGRDGSRVPLPWRSSAPNFGFSDAEAASPPWLPQPAWFADFAVETETRDEASTLTFYRRALAARKELDPSAPLEWVELGREDVVAFRRGRILSVTVFDGVSLAVAREWGRCVASSGAVGETIPAGTTMWFDTGGV